MLLRIAAFFLTAFLAAYSASAQTGLVVLPGDQFGKIVIRMPQGANGLSMVELQNVLGRNANFEPLSTYREQDRFRKIALPVGRLDLLVPVPTVAGSGFSWCTASILSATHIITNAHCFPEGQGGVRRAILVMDYYSDDNEAAVRRFDVNAVPVERNKELDFAIAEVSGNPSATFGRIALELRDPEPGESLLVIHHPMGRPKHMTRGGCRAHAPVSVQGMDIRHRCDTMPGSSGSPILSESSGKMLGLHYGGSLDALSPGSFNSGKRLTEIAKRSRIVTAAIAGQRQDIDVASRAGDAQRAMERAEIERKAREQAEAAARTEIERLKSQLDAERARAASGPVALTPQPPRVDANSEWSAAEAALGLSTGEIRYMQGWLDALGHDPRGIDGRLGAGTRAALRSYQRAKGLPETGYFDSQLVGMLVAEGPDAEHKRDSARSALSAVARPSVPPVARPSPASPPAITREPQAAFRDCHQCPEMVPIPLGATRLASGWDVTITTQFAVGKFEITFEEWDACATDGSCLRRPADRGWGRGRQPVVNVSWEDAQQYVAWLSWKSGRAYRLLSEAEWEYAAQAGAGRDVVADRDGNSANCDGCGSRWDKRQTAPVGSFAANSFGLHDMLGNVWEWTADCWNDSHAGAPDDGSTRTSGDCSIRVLRGGSWNSIDAITRTGMRLKGPTASRVDFVGFRVARAL